jgi:hypothetical protein
VKQCSVGDGVNVVNNSNSLKAEQLHLKANVPSMAAIDTDSEKKVGEALKAVEGVL